MFAATLESSTGIYVDDAAQDEWDRDEEQDMMLRMLLQIWMMTMTMEVSYCAELNKDWNTTNRSPAQDLCPKEICKQLLIP